MDINIVVIVRTRDEEHNIAKFCEAYKDADKILVGDGGSLDNTVEIAKSFPNVEVREYWRRVELDNGYWRNPDSHHTNWMIKWAKEFEPTWIISDDCDCRPNRMLRDSYKNILQNAKLRNVETVLAVRVYLWGLEEYFPKLSSPLGEPNGQGSLYAWRGNLDLWTVDAFPHFTFRLGDMPIKEFRTDTECLELVFPYCLLHHSWDTLERAEIKVAYHNKSGLTPGMRMPTEWGGNRKPLLDFMYE